MGVDLTGDEIARDDAARVTVDDDEIEHLRARIHGDGAGLHLALQSLVGAQQKLLPGLASCIERPRYLRATERAIRQGAAVFTSKRHALRDALIDDVHADLSEAIDVRFAGAEVAAFHGVIEEAVHAVAIILVILRGVDATLRRDGVRAPGRILEAETLYVVAEFAERCGSGSSGKDGAPAEQRTPRR